MSKTKQQRINDLAWELADLILVNQEDRPVVQEEPEDLEEELGKAVGKLRE